MTILEVRDERLLAVVQDGELTQRATGFGFLEGAVWSSRRDDLVFSDIPNAQMHQLGANDDVSIYRDPSNMANGNVYDFDGRLVTCEHATSRVVREEKDGSITVLADSFGGRELNSPNDVIIASDGAVIFSDPIYGRVEYYGVPRPPGQPVRGVYRIDPSSGSVTLLVDDFEQPNGLCETDDGQHLFINDTERGHIRRFTWRQQSLEGGEVWAEVKGSEPGGADGLKIDSAGNVFCCGPGGVHIFSSDSTCLGVIKVPEVVANFDWGDADRRTLYLCASSSLYSVRVLVPGRSRSGQ